MILLLNMKFRVPFKLIILYYMKILVFYILQWRRCKLFLWLESECVYGHEVDREFLTTSLFSTVDWISYLKLFRDFIYDLHVCTVVCKV